ncbi:hypothetical protein [Nocardia callitridis]|uniref:Serine hydrolase n=1 Tax=Nocardia callitridis TaxID=648753 RepID=A0ABP9KSC2_9NOCA
MRTGKAARGAGRSSGGVIPLKAMGATTFAVLLLLCGCGSGADANPEEAGAASSVTGGATGGDTGESLLVTIPGTLAASVVELQGTVRGGLGMAIMPVGGQRAATFGDWRTGPAWSTMKVPLVIAAARNSPGSYTSAASSAITASDNSAADTLWQSLGTGKEAAQAVEQVLREGGDTATTVPDTTTRSDASAFGQSDWALADQVRFASQLPCLPQSEQVITLMSKIISSQRWGLGTFTSAEFKGGWGPDAQGQYLVRQFGLVSTDTGQIAIAMAAQPDSGTFADGMNMLDKLADVVAEHIGELTGGSCPA